MAREPRAAIFPLDEGGGEIFHSLLDRQVKLAVLRDFAESLAPG